MGARKVSYIIIIIIIITIIISSSIINIIIIIIIIITSETGITIFSIISELKSEFLAIWLVERFVLFSK